MKGFTFSTSLICGNTRLVGLLGDPVAHSVSPLIHNRLFSISGLSFAYIPLRVRTDNIYTAVCALRSFDFAGANVTIPHKRTVLPYCDILSPLSALIGAVNTLYFRDGLLHGTTTDPEGFFSALKQMNFGIKNSSIVILGSGGTSRTLAIALALQNTPSRLVIAARNEKKAAELANYVSRHAGFEVCWTSLGSPQFAKYVESSNLLVNCTPVGMYPAKEESPVEKSLLHKDLVVFDTVYNPVQTKLLFYAEQTGCKCQNGLTMLLEQAYASFEYWCGVKPPSLDVADIAKIIQYLESE